MKIVCGRVSDPAFSVFVVPVSIRHCLAYVLCSPERSEGPIAFMIRFPRFGREILVQVSWVTPSHPKSFASLFFFGETQNAIR
jgi:hypothetical protein